MRFIKRAICFAMSFVFLAGSVAFAETDGYAETDSFLFEKLNSLGIWNTDIADTAEAVTRGQFAVLAAQLLGMEPQTLHSAPHAVFDDVADSDKAYAAVSFLADKGVVGGDGGIFCPERAITYNEAVKILVCALGYEAPAIAKGGYPGGYVSTAIRYRLIQNSFAGGDSYLSAHDCADMLEYAAEAKIMEPVYGNGGDYVVSDYDALHTYHNIDIAEGMLYAAGDVSLVAGDADYSNALLVDGKRIAADDDAYGKYVGFYVSVYYYAETPFADERVLFVDPHADENDVFTIDGDDITGYKNGSVTYEENGSVRTKRLTDSVATRVLFNNSPSELTESDVINADKIIVIDNRRGDKVVKVESYDTYVTDVFEHNNDMLIDRFADGAKVHLGNDSGAARVRIVNHLGVPSDFYAIKKNTVVRIAKSKDDRFCSVILTDVKKSGVISEVDLDARTVVIDGVSYTAARKSFAATQLSDVKVGAKYTAYFDDLFRIVAFERDLKTDEKYGYLTDASCGNGIDEKLRLKLYTQNDRFEKFDAAERITVDGESYKNGSDVLSLLRDENGGIKPQLVRYRLDDGGKMCYLDTAATGAKERGNGTYYGNPTLTKFEPFAGGRFIGDPVMFGAETYNSDDNKQYNVRMVAKTPVFCVPPFNATRAELDDEDNYCYTNIRVFENYKTYKENASKGIRVEAYDLNSNWTAAIIVYHTPSTTVEHITDSTPITVVEKIVRKLDKDGNEYAYLERFQSGNFISVPIRKGFENLTKEYYADGGTVKSTVRFGDVIRFSLDSRGRIDDYEKVFSLTDEDNPRYVKWGNEVNSANTSQENPSLIAVSDDYSENGYNVPLVYKKNETFEAEYRVVYGMLKERVGNNIVLSVGGDNPMTIVGDIQKYNVLTVDEELGKMHMSDLNEYIPESVAGENNGVRILMHTTKGSSRTVVLVKRKTK